MFVLIFFLIFYLKTQVWVVSASDPQLPLQIEDAGRRVTEDEEGNFAKVSFNI